jgi:D-lactate dehydrogenase
MRVAVFSTRPYDTAHLTAANEALGGRHDLVFLESTLDATTATLARGCGAVCAFVNDHLDEGVLHRFKAMGVDLVALRCAGFNNVDLVAADALGITVVRVPAYSPHAVAEFTIGLLLAANRRIHRAWARTRENNFALDGLVGRNLYGQLAGVVGTGRIGALVARSLRAGFGCEVLACDPVEDEELKAIGVQYVPREELLERASIISLHCPLTPESHHLIDAAMLARAQEGLLLVNTSRGALIDTTALIEALKTGRVGAVALDVYEQEGDLFFRNLSDTIITDDTFQRLLTFPNVLVTGHQAFLTREALDAIATTTIRNISAAQDGEPHTNAVTAAMLR